MNRQLDAIDARTLKALQDRQDRSRFLTANSGQWLRLRSKLTNRVVAYAIPSSRTAGHYWTTNGRDCDCPDHRLRTVDCKHMLAARAYVAGRQIKIEKGAA